MTSEPSQASNDNRAEATSRDTKRGGLGRTTVGEETAASADPPAEIPRKIGKYELRQLLGKGGVGTVYLGYDPLIDREVAIKILRSNLSQDHRSLQRFLAEARAAGRLKHPNAITIYDIGEDDGVHFLVMELAEGGSVSDLLQEQTRLSFAEAARIVMQAARGLEAAHDAGLVHRDVKPENLMLSADGTVKLVDFGLSKEIDGGSNMALTQTGAVLGTPLYMSPEQIKSQELDARTDVYSLGATFYHLMTGEAPFGNNTITGLVYAHLEAERPDPRKLNPDVPAECHRLIAKSMAVDPQERYGSITDFIRELGELTNARTAQQPVTIQRNTASVLVVEPSRLGVRVVADVFRKAGWEDVAGVESAAEALQHVERHPSTVVITTRQLGDSTGALLLERIREINSIPNAVYGLMSTDPPQELMAESTVRVGSVFIQKQSPSEILKAVHASTPLTASDRPANHDSDCNSVTVVTQDGSIPSELTAWLTDVNLVGLSSKSLRTGPAMQLEPGLIVWITSPSLPADHYATCAQESLGHAIADGSTVAVVSAAGLSLRLRGVIRTAFIACVDRDFDAARLRQLMAFT